MASEKRRKSKYRKGGRSRAGNAALFLILMTFAVFMALPIVLAVSNSLKPLDELWEFPPKLVPREPTLENYSDMFDIMSSSLVPFSRYIANTLLITLVGSAGNMLFSAMCAFVLAKGKLPGRRVLFKIVEKTMMFNHTVMVIPTYVIMSRIGWIDSPLALIVPAFASTLGLYLIKQFMETAVPDALLEAARVDGAGLWKMFWRIVVPCIRPALLTNLLLSVQALWTVGVTSYIFSDEKKTLSYSLSQIVSGGVSRAGVGAAVTVFMMIVPVTVFLLCQRNILDTMSTSGMKE